MIAWNMSSLEKSFTRPGAFRRACLDKASRAGGMRLSEVEALYLAMDSNLHLKSREARLDGDVLCYVVPRLPDCLPLVREVLLLPCADEHTLNEIRPAAWRPVTARSRRRNAFFDGESCLALMLNSVSDLDDIFPALAGWQIEWNKAHRLLRGEPESLAVNGSVKGVLQRLGLDEDASDRVAGVFGDPVDDFLRPAGAGKLDITMRIAGCGVQGYDRGAGIWVENLLEQAPELTNSKEGWYFCSSNLYTLANMTCGFSSRISNELDAYIRKHAPEQIRMMLHLAESHGDQVLFHDIRYFALQEFLSENPEMLELRDRSRSEQGIREFSDIAPLHLGAQVFQLSKMRPENYDPRVPRSTGSGVLLNIDYPLGFLAYHVLKELMAVLGKPRGIHVMGKAATLQGQVGDVILPNRVYSQHGGVGFLFENALTPANVAPRLRHNEVLGEQGALTAWGPVLVDYPTMLEFKASGFNSIEMEAGVYLACYAEHLAGLEMPGRGEMLRLPNLPQCPVSIAHYASDNPLNPTQLLSRSLGLSGVQPVCACGAAVLKLILEGPGD